MLIAYCFNKSIGTFEAFYAGPHHEDEETLMMYGKSQNQVYHRPPEQTVSTPLIFLPFGNYQRDHPGWADRLLKNEKQADVQNIVSHQCRTHEQYSPDCSLQSKF